MSSFFPSELSTAWLVTSPPAPQDWPSWMTTVPAGIWPSSAVTWTWKVTSCPTWAPPAGVIDSVVVVAYGGPTTAWAGS